MKRGNTWLVVAGGGGGAGSSGRGGGGGGTDGEDGRPENTLSGRGGTPGEAGRGGESLHGANNGRDGKFTEGGIGGDNPEARQGDGRAGVGGGGGGGGYMAGGGGGGDTRPFAGDESGGRSGGGGGGSGYIDANGTFAGAVLLRAEGPKPPRSDDPRYRRDAGQGGKGRSDGALATGGEPGLVVLSTAPHVSSPWPDWD